MVQAEDYRAWPFLMRYWRTQNFVAIDHTHLKPTRLTWLLLLVMRLGMVTQILVGLLLVYLWRWQGLPGGWAFGLAVIISYPVVWAHVLALLVAVGQVLDVKRLGRRIVCGILERQVVALRRRHPLTVVAVAGSIGKTSTKLAIAKVLSANHRVIYDDGNYNDRVTVPLVLFGRREPASLRNVFAWGRLLAGNGRLIRGEYPYDIAVLELGSDHPGQLAEFAYLQPDIGVVTAVAAEHMEFFGTLDAVADEELHIAAFSKRLLVNADDTAPQYREKLPRHTTYGLQAPADYQGTYRRKEGLAGGKITLRRPHGRALRVDTSYIGTQGAKIVVAALAVADMLEVPAADIAKAGGQLGPCAGRLQLLPGVQDTTLIDDTYNASPAAVTAALDVLYGTKASQRIAILGNMNELGALSPDAHREAGAYCDPAKLALVVTIGPDANRYLAPEAERQGCTVVRCASPYKAGEYVRRKLEAGGVVLAKGSQNGVFAEEALKLLLRDPADATKLVRQSAAWMRVKQAQFGPVPVLGSH